MKHLLIALLVLVALAWSPVPASAAACAGGAFTTADMAGLYISQPNMMALVVEPCGAMRLTWDNAYGRHRATYQAMQTFDSGGYVGQGIANDSGVFLDGQTAMGVAPAEPGWIQILTISPYGTDLHVYRLEKTR